MPQPLGARPLTILDAIYGRRSVRAFAPTPLAPATIQALLDAAVQAPTAMHDEPWQFVVLQDRAVLHQLSERATRAIQRSAPPAPLRGSAGDRLQPAGFATRLTSPDFNVFYDAPVVIAIGTTGHRAFATADCWLAAGNLMLAAWGLGIGSCCIGAAVDTLNAPVTQRELALPPELTIVAAIALGIPAGPPPPSDRRPPSVLAWR